MGEKEEKLDVIDNVAFDSLGMYCRSFGLTPRNYVEDKFVLAKFRYGKAKIEGAFSYTDKTVMLGVVFDLRDVYEKYGKQFNDFEVFLDKVKEKLPANFFRQKGEEIKFIGENITVLGRGIVGHTADSFNKYCVWAPPLKELYDALDSLLNLNLGKIDKDMVDKAVVKGYKKAFSKLFGIAAFGLALGIALIVLSILSIINAIAGWIFGVIFVLAGLFFIYASSFGIQDIKGYLNNKRDDKFFITLQ